MIYCTVHVVFSFWLTRNMRNMANDKQVFLVYSIDVTHVVPPVSHCCSTVHHDIDFPYESTYVGIWCKICSKQFSPSSE